MGKFTTVDEVFENLSFELEGVIEHLNKEYDAVRVGRANPKILDRVMADYYGTKTPLNQMANISVPEPRMLMVSVWDQSMLKEVVRAINEANLGVTPSDDGKVIRLVFPAMTEERRKQVAKDIKKMAEDSKVSARNVRREALDELKALKKDNVITEDDLVANEKEVQKEIDNTVAKIEDIFAKKEKDVLSI